MAVRLNVSAVETAAGRNVVKGKIGASTAGVFVGKRARLRDQRKRDEEKQRWDSLAGPLTVTWVDPEQLRRYELERNA